MPTSCLLLDCHGLLHPVPWTFGRSTASRRRRGDWSFPGDTGADCGCGGKVEKVGDEYISRGKSTIEKRTVFPFLTFFR